ncbi:MAG: hypothetical protein HOP10_13835 [Chitinophagaceae bacterium]|nr:hypothetical protein [Chitinophagaceae bacterium]
MNGKFLCPVIILLLCNSLKGQINSNTYTKEKIDSIVSKTDIVLEKKQRTFDLTLYRDYIAKKTYTQKWTYLRDPKNLLYFRVNYTLDSTDYEEEYYLHEGTLIFATEKEVWRFPSMNPVDSMGWSGVFYFSKGKLIYQSTLGHGKSELDNWDPEKEIWMRHSKRRYNRPELLKWSK